MASIMEIIRDFKAPCPCGKVHETAVRDVAIAPGLVNCVGDILKRNGFPERLLLVADRNTYRAAEGIEESLTGFRVTRKIYDNLRVATMTEVEEIEALIRGQEIAVLSVGTGSVNDPCRLAAAREDKLLCVFATAPSMDGFASYGAPIVKDGFKSTYAAKSPEVIIGDTAILSAAPKELKSAGFGDMMAKYVGLIDWEVASLCSGEYYCPRVAALTREATDELLGMADRVTENDEETAGKIFESLLKTGIAMSFTKNSRPASGSEHIIAHLIECVELRDDIVPNYHGEDVGVCTLETLRFYGELSERPSIRAEKETVDWQDIFTYYGSMADEVRALNMPENIIDTVDLKVLEEHWQDICAIIKSVPDYETCRAAMEKAGCKLTREDIGKDEKLFSDCMKYSPYMRRRLTLLRMRDLLK